DPQPFGGQAGGRLAHQRHHGAHLGQIGRVDVIYARTDVVRISEILEGAQQLHVRTRRLDGDDVGIHGGDGFDDVVEFRIAHVGVDLRAVLDAGRGQAEAVHGPVQVGLPVAAAQRQPFAEGRFVYLDDADAGALEIGD